MSLSRNLVDSGCDLGRVEKKPVLRRSSPIISRQHGLVSWIEEIIETSQPSRFFFFVFYHVNLSLITFLLFLLFLKWSETSINFSKQHGFAEHKKGPDLSTCEAPPTRGTYGHFLYIYKMCILYIVQTCMTPSKGTLNYINLHDQTENYIVSKRCRNWINTVPKP